MPAWRLKRVVVRDNPEIEVTAALLAPHRCDLDHPLSPDLPSGALVMTAVVANTSAWSLWRRNLLIWAALLVLLGLTFALAYVPLGPFNAVTALGIAAIKAGLVALLFMGLRRSGSLIRLAAAAGLFWLIILFALTLSDFLTRILNG